ncbi:MAG: hypothetical protein PVF34_12975 [Gammaproteobacteria bacterium]|jgi:hypothetical protein
MSTQKDPLMKQRDPDRLYYALGALLDKDDFTREQTYHRGRLGRGFAYLHGIGTVAGLEVTVEDRDGEDVLMVSAGMALDRLGRIIEIPRAACLRVAQWFDVTLDDPIGHDQLVNSFRTGSGGDPDGVVVDVFVKFVVCERGKQPAFATGNFDALDAIATSSVRDSYQLELVIREESTLPAPDYGFPDLTGLTPEQIKERVLQYKLQEAWKETTAWTGPGETLAPMPEHVQGQDGTEVLLARLIIPATNPPLQRDTNVDIVIDNAIRQLVFSTAELAWLTDNI